MPALSLHDLLQREERNAPPIAAGTIIIFTGGLGYDHGAYGAYMALVDIDRGAEIDAAGLKPTIELELIAARSQIDNDAPDPKTLPDGLHVRFMRHLVDT